MAWDAVIELTGPEGVRRVPIKDFYIKAKVVDIRPAEIQTAILIPKESYDRCVGHYIKYSMRNALDIATTGCSVNVRLSEDKKTFERVRVGYGVASPIPVRAPSAEEFINGKEITDENIKTFAETVLQDINPRDSWRASRALRRHISVVMAERALRECITLAGGEVNG
jgi:xanthine dehydrogenase FAD-binding subunit